MPDISSLVHRTRNFDRSFDRKAWWWCFLVLTVFKLILVAHSEIETGLFDETAYANTSLHWFGERDLTIEDFQRPPGLPIFAQAVRQIGLPYRMAIELLACGSIGFLTFHLSRLMKSHLIGTILAGLLIFHPWLLENARTFMSEPPFLAASLCWLACLAALLESNAPGWKSPWLWASGFCLLFMSMTRLEQPVILAFALAAWLGLCWASRPLKERGVFIFFRRGWACLLIPAVLVIAGKQLVCLINYEKCGIPAICYLEAPGLLHLLQTLNDIQAPDPQQYAPITTRSFEMAMQASPSLRLLKEPMATHRILEIRTTQRFLQGGEQGWHLMWDLIHSSEEIQSTLPHGSQAPSVLNAYWQQCADELQAALKRGELPRAYYAPYPLNPNYGLWVWDYPKSWWKEIRCLWKLRSPSQDDEGTSARGVLTHPWAENAALTLNQAANRRVTLLPYSFLDGYAYSRRGAVDGVFLEDSDGTRLGDAFSLTEDFLPSQLASLLTVPPAGKVLCRFTIYLPYAVPSSARLVLIKDGQRISVQPISGGAPAEEAVLPKSDIRDGMAKIRIEEIRPQGADFGWRAHVKKFILRDYHWIEAIASLTCFLLASISPGNANAAPRPPAKIAVFLAIMITALLIRSSFYALSDACALPDLDRYPRALALWVTILIVGASVSLGRLAGLSWLSSKTRI